MPLPQTPEAKPKYFTVEEANKALPLIRAIVGDIVEQYGTVMELKQRLAVVGRSQDRGRRKPAQADVYAEELAHTEALLEAEQTKLRDFVEELERLGVELKGPEGLCDFPARIDGRDVYLCWRLGEPEVLYWHEIEAGFDGRKPLSVRGAAPVRN